jgi:hypothetical protein
MRPGPGGCPLKTTENRRRFERFALRPMYTPVAVRVMEDEAGDKQEGHAYDVSEGGLRFELDQAIKPGTAVVVRFTLPGPEPERSVYAVGNVVWVNEEEPGPAQMAAVFTRFARAADRDRLLRHLSTGVLARAA